MAMTKADLNQVIKLCYACYFLALKIYLLYNNFSMWFLFIFLQFQYFSIFQYYQKTIAWNQHNYNNQVNNHFGTQSVNKILSLSVMKLSITLTFQYSPKLICFVSPACCIASLFSAKALPHTRHLSLKFLASVYCHLDFSDSASTRALASTSSSFAGKTDLCLVDESSNSGS